VGRRDYQARGPGPGQVLVRVAAERVIAGLTMSEYLASAGSGSGSGTWVSTNF
jgi:hypothetical protein